MKKGIEKTLNEKRAELMAKLGVSEDAYNDRIKGIKEKIADNQGKIDDVSKRLDEAIANADTDNMMKLNLEKDSVVTMGEMLKESLKSAQTMPIYSKTEIADAYLQYCKALDPEWRAVVEDMKKAAAAYNDAFETLKYFADKVLETRKDVEKREDELYLKTYFTDGMRENEFVNSMQIERNRASILAEIFHPVMHARSI